MTEVLPRTVAMAAARAAARRSRLRSPAAASASRPGVPPVRGARVVRPARSVRRDGPPFPPADRPPVGNSREEESGSPPRPRPGRGRQERYGETDGEAEGGGNGAADVDDEDAGTAGAAEPKTLRMPVLSVRRRWTFALTERLPLWLQKRCGVDPKAIAAVVLVLLVALGFAVHHFWSGRPQAVPAPRTDVAGAGAPSHAPVPGARPSGSGAAPPPGSAGGASGKQLVVDVAGKVEKPGIYRLKPGSRVADALKAAGGVHPGTNVSGLNRARLVVDGEQIVAGGGPAAPGGAAAPQAAGPSAAGSTGPGSGPSGSPVSLNSATAEQLETLPGVGPVLARHIVEYRQQHGGFRSVDQLRQVTGIGQRRFSDLKSAVTP